MIVVTPMGRNAVPDRPGSLPGNVQDDPGTAQDSPRATRDNPGRFQDPSITPQNGSGDHFVSTNFEMHTRSCGDTANSPPTPSMPSSLFECPAKSWGKTRKIGTRPLNGPLSILLGEFRHLRIYSRAPPTKELKYTTYFAAKKNIGTWL